MSSGGEKEMVEKGRERERTTPIEREYEKEGMRWERGQEWWLAEDLIAGSTWRRLPQHEPSQCLTMIFVMHMLCLAFLQWTLRHVHWQKQLHFRC